MGIAISTPDGSVVQAQDPTHQAGRTSIHPRECQAWCSVAGATQNLTGTSIVAGCPVFALRYTGAGNARLLVRRLQLQWVTYTFSAIARIDFALSLVRNWTTFDSGGTDCTVARHRLEHSAPNVAAKIAAAAALTAGVRSIDGVIGVTGYASLANGNGLPLTSLLSHDAGDHPVVLRQNEGLLVTMPAVPANAAVTFGWVQGEVLEVASYP